MMGTLADQIPKSFAVSDVDEIEPLTQETLDASLSSVDVESTSSYSIVSSDQSEVGNEANDEESSTNEESSRNIGTETKEIKPQPKKARLWSYIKRVMKGTSENVDDTDSDLPIYINWVDRCDYSAGTTKLIKKLTNLYSMLSDPEVGIMKTSKSNISFSGRCF